MKRFTLLGTKHKLVTITFGMLMVVTCYAYKIYEIASFSEPLTEQSLSLKEIIDARLPAKSRATAGLVRLHNTNKIQFSNTIFIIGDDAYSKDWLIRHCDELKRYQAIGFVTNIEDHQHFEDLQSLVGLPLLPANVDDLLALVGASHYPLIVYQGDVWQ